MSDEWGQVEIFGHRRHYGRISEFSRFGVLMLRIDTPAGDDVETFFYGGAAIFSITPMTEEKARSYAQLSRVDYIPLMYPSQQVPDEIEPDFAEVEPAPETGVPQSQGGQLVDDPPYITIEAPAHRPDRYCQVCGKPDFRNGDCVPEIDGGCSCLPF